MEIINDTKKYLNSLANLKEEEKKEKKILFSMF